MPNEASWGMHPDNWVRPRASHALAEDIETTRSIDSPDERDESADEQAESEASTGHACPDCGGSLVTDDSRGETVCESCGLVVDEDEIDHGPEWRAYDDRSATTSAGSARRRPR